jgi:hypothetical protein
VNAPTIVTIVIGAFFLIGIAVGVVAVIAASVLRTSVERAQRERLKRGHQDAENGAGWIGSGMSATQWTDVGPGWEEPPESGEDNDEDEGPPRWPGGRRDLITRSG